MFTSHLQSMQTREGPLNNWLGGIVPLVLLLDIFTQGKWNMNHGTVLDFFSSFLERIC